MAGGSVGPAAVAQDGATQERVSGQFSSALWRQVSAASASAESRQTSTAWALRTPPGVHVPTDPSSSCVAPTPSEAGAECERAGLRGLLLPVDPGPGLAVSSARPRLPLPAPAASSGDAKLCPAKTSQSCSEIPSKPLVLNVTSVCKCQGWKATGVKGWRSSWETLGLRWGGGVPSWKGGAAAIGLPLLTSTCGPGEGDAGTKAPSPSLDRRHCVKTVDAGPEAHVGTPPPQDGGWRWEGEGGKARAPGEGHSFRHSFMEQPARRSPGSLEERSTSEGNRSLKTRPSVSPKHGPRPLQKRKPPLAEGTRKPARI